MPVGDKSEGAQPQDDQSKTKSENWSEWRRNRRTIYFVPSIFVSNQNISCMGFLTSPWPEGCLIALIAEEKGNCHCEGEEVSNIKAPPCPSLCPASSNHLTPTPSPFHNSLHNPANPLERSLLIAAPQDVTQQMVFSLQTVHANGEQNANAFGSIRVPKKSPTQLVLRKMDHSHGTQMVQLKASGSTQTL